MADEATEILDPETPDTQTPEAADTPTEEPGADDWHKRYTDLQPEYTRATQTLSDEDRLLAHIQEKFPHLLADEEDEIEDTPDDDTAQEPSSVKDPRVDELAEWKQAEEQRRAQEQFEKDYTEAIGDREVSERGRKFIVNECFSNGANAEALKTAVQEWFDEVDSYKPKPRRRVPHVPDGGDETVAPERPKTDQERVALAMARIQAEQA